MKPETLNYICDECGKRITTERQLTKLRGYNGKLFSLHECPHCEAWAFLRLEDEDASAKAQKPAEVAP